MSDQEARKVVKRALADKRTKFVWHPTHRKKMGSDSGRRYVIYSQKVVTYEDYQPSYHALAADPNSVYVYT